MRSRKRYISHRLHYLNKEHSNELCVVSLRLTGLCVIHLVSAIADFNTHIYL